MLPSTLFNLKLFFVSPFILFVFDTLFCYMMTHSVLVVVLLTFQRFRQLGRLGHKPAGPSSPSPRSHIPFPSRVIHIPKSPPQPYRVRRRLSRSPIPNSAAAAPNSQAHPRRLRRRRLGGLWPGSAAAARRILALAPTEAGVGSHARRPSSLHPSIIRR
jgi:hypothetical protein